MEICLREGNGKPLKYSCLKNSMNCMKRQKVMTPEDELPRKESVHYATGKEQRAITNRSRKSKKAGPKRKRCSVMDVFGGRSKVWCSKEEYFVGTLKVRSMNEGKSDMVKQEMARVNSDILGISELIWTGMDKFNQMTIIFTTVGKNSLEEME